MVKILLKAKRKHPRDLPFYSNISYHKYFIKDFEKLSEKIQDKLIDYSFPLFLKGNCEILRQHALKGKYLGTFSIDITGDVRAIFILINKDYRFLRIGTHSQLYG